MHLHAIDLHWKVIREIWWVGTENNSLNLNQQLNYVRSLVIVVEFDHLRREFSPADNSRKDRATDCRLQGLWKSTVHDDADLQMQVLWFAPKLLSRVPTDLEPSSGRWICHVCFTIQKLNLRNFKLKLPNLSGRFNCDTLIPKNGHLNLTSYAIGKFSFRFEQITEYLGYELSILFPNT